MTISIEVNNLKIDQLINILDKLDATSSFLITDYGREFTFGELKKSTDSKAEN